RILQSDRGAQRRQGARRPAAGRILQRSRDCRSGRRQVVRPIADDILMLFLDRVTVDIQNSRILRAVSLRVAAGELVCLVGRNGAGKTTTLRTIMGYLQPAAGGIEFQGASLVRMRTDR